MPRLLPRRAKQWLRAHGGPLGSIVSVRTASPHFVLTYDDGPDAIGTPAVMNALAEMNASATFFVLLTRVRAHRTMVTDALAAGHEIALHGPDHRAISRMPYSAVLNRTRAAKEELEDAIGRPVRWFRPPYGLQSLTSFRAVLAAGLTPVMWGPTAYDSRPASDETRLARALRGAEPGAILLCHDAYAGFTDGGRSNDPPAIDRGSLARLILSAYAERGLEPRSLGDLLKAGEPVRGMWFAR